jgi:hypothetical protein
LLRGPPLGGPLLGGPLLGGPLLKCVLLQPRWSARPTRGNVDTDGATVGGTIVDGASVDGATVGGTIVDGDVSTGRGRRSVTE